MKDEKSSRGEGEIGNYLADDERKKLIANLHRVLVWVGVKVPEKCWIDMMTLDSEMEKLHQTEGDLPPEIHLHKTEKESELPHCGWK